MSALPKVVAGFKTSLASKITSSATSLTVASVTNKAGNALSGLYGIKLDGGSSGEEYFIGTFSGTTFTIIARGIDPVDGKTEVAALKHEHRKGAKVEVTDFALLAVVQRTLNGDETLPNKLSYASVPTVSADTDIISKKYADDLALAGAPNASTTVKGVAEIATDAELAAGTGTGGTGAATVATGSSFTATPAANKVPVANASGKLAAGWGGAASTLATLNASAKVVEDPANATATPTASKIPIANGAGKLAEGWMQMTNAQATSLTGGITSPLNTLHAHRMKVFAASRDMTLASGSVTYAHGLGAIPNWVKIYAGAKSADNVYSGWSDGMYDRVGGNAVAIYSLYQNASQLTFGSDTTNAVYITVGYGSQAATCTVDATNVTLTWTKSSLPTGTAYLKFEVGV